MLRIETYNGRVSAIDTLLHELATLRAENKHLRSKLNRHLRGSAIVRAAIADAHAIILAAFSDQSTGVRAMATNYGMTRRRWEWGVAFLRYAGIVPLRNRSWRNGLQFLITDLSEAIGLLETSAKELDTPDGYRRLRATLYARKM